MRETDTDPRKTHIDRQPPTYNFDLSTLRFTYTEAKELIQLSVRVGQFQQKLSWRDISEACIQTTVHWLQLELTELGLSDGLIGLLKEAVRKQLEDNTMSYVMFHVNYFAIGGHDIV